MKPFSQHLVTTRKQIDVIMRFAIGNSWDNLEGKYPKRLPALLVLDEETKHFDYVYPNVFRETAMKHIYKE